MPIVYHVTKCSNPRNRDVDYFKNTAVKTGELHFEKLAKRINDSTTVTVPMTKWRAAGFISPTCQATCAVKSLGNKMIG